MVQPVTLRTIWPSGEDTVRLIDSELKWLQACFITRDPTRSSAVFYILHDPTLRMICLPEYVQMFDARISGNISKQNGRRIMTSSYAPFIHPKAPVWSLFKVQQYSKDDRAIIMQYRVRGLIKDGQRGQSDFGASIRGWSHQKLCAEKSLWHRIFAKSGWRFGAANMEKPHQERKSVSCRPGCVECLQEKGREGTERKRLKKTNVNWCEWWWKSKVLSDNGIFGFTNLPDLEFNVRKESPWLEESECSVLRIRFRFPSSTKKELEKI